MINSVVGNMKRFTASFDAALENHGADGVGLSVAKFYPGGVPALLDRLKETGHGAAVASWIGSGSNEAMCARGLAAILPPGTVKAIAWDLGIPPDRVAIIIARFLPSVVDRDSPAGQLRDQPSFDTTRAEETRCIAEQTVNWPPAPF